MCTPCHLTPPTPRTAPRPQTPPPQATHSLKNSLRERLTKHVAMQQEMLQHLDALVSSEVTKPAPEAPSRELEPALSSRHASAALGREQYAPSEMAQFPPAAAPSQHGAAGARLKLAPSDDLYAMAGCHAAAES